MLKRYFRLHIMSLGGAIGRVVSQPVASALTVLVIAIALALPASLQVFVNNASNLSGSWEGAIDFTIYLDMSVDEEEARRLAAEIEARQDVEAMVFISRTEAMEEFRARSGFGKALDALEDNPLPHSIVVRPAGGAAGAVEDLGAALDAYEQTALVQLDTQWVQRLRGMLVLFGRVVDIATILLAMAVVLVIGNTIRLEINNRSTEIEVMKLVGGTDGFIRRPFLYLGLSYGLLGAVSAAVLIGLALALLRGPASDLAELYAASFRLRGLSLKETGILFAGGALLGWAGAWLASARHLRAIEPA